MAAALRFRFQGKEYAFRPELMTGALERELWREVQSTVTELADAAGKGAGWAVAAFMWLADRQSGGTAPYKLFEGLVDSVRGVPADEVDFEILADAEEVAAVPQL